MRLLGGEVDTIKNCANPECDVTFMPTRHNQKYHSKECCKLVTNAKIMQQYYEKKDRRAGKKRICQRCEVTALSRYNEGLVCQPCLSAEQSANRLSLLQLMGIA